VIFSPQTLSALRAFQESSLTETATIQDPQGTPVSDGQGGVTYTPATIATEACRVAPINLARAEAMFGGQFRDVIPYEIALPVTTQAQESYRLIVAGVTYEIVALWRGGTYQTVTKAICIRR
jgi:hypothetical protein